MTDGDQACYVYGVVAAGTTLPTGVAGVAESSIEVVEHGDIAAVVSAVVPERPFGRADLVAHGRILDALVTERSVVPIRFGAVLPSGSHVADEMLEPHGEQFRELLEELAGRKQYNLRGRYDEATVLTEVVAESPEIAELRRQTRDKPEAATYYSRIRLGELVAHALAGKREADSRVILDTLLPHSVTYRLRDGARIDHLVDAAFLVDAERLEAFDQAAEGAAATLHGRATLRLIGPVAPYDFVSEI